MLTQQRTVPPVTARAAAPPQGIQAQLLHLNEQIVQKQAELRQVRIYRRFGLLAAALGPLGLATCILIAKFTWRQYDMAFWNAFGFPAFILMTIAGFVFCHRYFFHSGADRIKSVHQVQLELDLLIERRKLQLATSSMSMEIKQKTYRGDIPTEIEIFRKESKHYRRIHNWLQGVIIVGSLATTTITGIALDSSPLQWAAVATSFSVGIAAGFTGYFKFRERSFYLQQTADAIEQEYVAVDMSIGRYRKLPASDALTEFVAVVERLKNEQRKREQNLEQSPEKRDT